MRSTNYILIIASNRYFIRFTIR